MTHTATTQSAPTNGQGRTVDNRADPAKMDMPALRHFLRECRIQRDKIKFQLDSHRAGQIKRENGWVIKAEHALRSFETAIQAAEEEMRYRTSSESQALNSAFVEAAREELEDDDFRDIMEIAKKRLSPALANAGTAA